MNYDRCITLGLAELITLFIAYRYLACAELKRIGCHGRAIMPVQGTEDDVRITKPHNHPPDGNAEERECFVAHLREAARSSPGSLKKVYDNVAMM